MFARVRGGFALAVAMLLAACMDGPVGPAGRPDDASLVVIDDVPALSLSMDAEIRRQLTDADAVAREVRADDGLAVVLLKADRSARAVDAGGRRAALTKQDVRAGMQALRAMGVEILELTPHSAMLLVRVDPAMIPQLMVHPAVDIVESRALVSPDGARDASGGAMLLRPDALLRARPEGFIPFTGETANAGGSQFTPWGVTMLNAHGAWPYTTGAGARVMVMGTGMYPHWDNPAIPAGNCGGLFGACSQIQSFATAAIGAIAARDDQAGVVGVAPGLPGSNVFVWRAINSSNLIDTQMQASGYYAINDANVRIVANIFSTNVYRAHVESAIQWAITQGAIVIAPVADEGLVNPARYPARYTGVLGIASVRSNGASTYIAHSECAYRSNIGPDVDFASPSNGWVPWAWAANDIDLGNMGCTSTLAASYFTGVVALVKDRNPTWTSAQIIDRIKETASGNGSWTQQLGWGIPDAGKAVAPPVPPVIPPTNPVSVSISGAAWVPAYASCGYSAGASGGDGFFTFEWYADGQFIGNGEYIMTSAASSYTLSVVARDGSGAIGSTGLSITVSPEAWSCYDQ